MYRLVGKKKKKKKKEAIKTHGTPRPSFRRGVSFSR
jgi:hypothetical protein